MKKIMIAAALIAAMTLSACGGKSEASREQISNAHDKAKEMLHQTHTQQPAAAKADSIAK